MTVLDPAATPSPPAGALAPPAVRMVGVSAGYGSRVALADVTLTIATGSLMAIIGPNGAGKSTLLKVIAGLLRPFAGTIEVLGGPPGQESRRIAYVPQAEVVDWGFPVTVGDVVMMGRVPLIGVGRSAGADDRAAVRQALETVDMWGELNRQIGALSGGQRRRVFLARAMAARPDLYLLDEPVTGVDVTTQEDLMEVLDREAALGKTLLATTHDLAAAAQHFGRLIAVNRTIIASGPAAEVLASDVLGRTYGGHLLVLDGQALLLDDAHHHDSEAPGEHHHHEGESRR